MKDIQIVQARNFRLAKKEILREREIITSLLNEGIQLRGKWCRLYYRLAERMKVAFIVSKRTGNAVRRNKIKRWLREVYRTNRDLIGISVEMAIMITEKRDALSFINLKEDLLKLFVLIKKDLPNSQ